MYIFVTYARADMKGVQVRGIRAASALPKREVLFYNQGDASWLKKHNYRYRDFSAGYYLPQDIAFPRHTKSVIFGDLPTNRPFEMSIFLAAQQKKIPCVILENLYNREQFTTALWRRFALLADKIVLNGPVLPRQSLPATATIVSALLNPPVTKQAKIQKTLDKYGLIGLGRYVFTTGYNPYVLKNLRRVAGYLRRHKIDLSIVVAAGSESNRVKKSGNLILLPSLQEEDFRIFLSRAALFLGKLGYLQVLEALSLEVPVLAVGRDQGFKISWLAPEMKPLVNYELSFGNRIVKKILFLAQNKTYRKKFQQNVSRLKLNRFDAIAKTGAIIQRAVFKQKKIERVVYLSIADDKTKASLARFSRQYPFLLPLIFNLNSQNNLLYEDQAFIKSSWQSIFHLSEHSFHSLAPLAPWLSNWSQGLADILRSADRVLVQGQQTAQWFAPLLGKLSRKKITLVR